MHGKYPRHDGGDTLLEVVIAVAITGIFAVALMNVLIESIGSSSDHRNLATADTLVKSYSDDIKQRVQLGYQSGSSGYTKCASAAYSDSAFADSNPQTKSSLAADRRFTVAVTKVEYLSPAGFVTTFGTGAIAPGTCDDQGVQRLTVTAQGPGSGGDTVTLQVLVRDPKYGSGYSS